MNNNDQLLRNLTALGLSLDESKVYIALLSEPMTHLQIARSTGVNRSKVYRVADDLIARGLLTKTVNDEGKELVANDPKNLESQIETEQLKIQKQKAALSGALPQLSDLFTNGAMTSADDFTVNTYQGVEGLKQMLWNELKTKNEICVFVHNYSLNKMAGKTWADKYRRRVTDLKIPHRILENTDAEHALESTSLDDYDSVYKVRMLPREVLDMQLEITIHDDTVSMYHWNDNPKGPRIGVEIHNKQFARMQQAIFENYWNLATA